MEVQMDLVRQSGLTAKVVAPIILVGYLAVSVLINHNRVRFSKNPSRAAENKQSGLGCAPTGSYFGWDTLKCSELAKGDFVGPGVLLGVRMLPILLFIATLYLQVNYFGFADDAAGKFTNFTFVLCAFAEVWGCIICAQSIKRVQHHGIPVQWDFVRKAYQLSFVCSMTAGVMLVGFYWAVLYTPADDGILNLIKHGGMQVLMLLDLLLSRVHIVSYHYPAVATYASVYVCYMWTFSAIRGQAVYDTLDLDNSGSIKYYVAFPVLMTAAFYFVYLLAQCRRMVGNFGKRRIGYGSLDQQDYTYLELVQRKSKQARKLLTKSSGELMNNAGKYVSFVTSGRVGSQPTASGPSL